MVQMAHAHPPTCQCGFVCSICGSVANLVQIFTSENNIKIMRFGFLGKVEFNRSPDELAKLSSAILSGDPKAVYDYDLEFVPCYCPTCDAVYCKDHWHHWVKFDEVEPWWFDSFRGRCPNGHERMLQD